MILGKKSYCRKTAPKIKNSYSGLETFPTPIFVLWVSPCRKVHDKINILSRLETTTSFKKSGRLKFAPEVLNHDRDRAKPTKFRKKLYQERCVISFHASPGTCVENIETKLFHACSRTCVEFFFRKIKKRL